MSTVALLGAAVLAGCGRYALIAVVDVDDDASLPRVEGPTPIEDAATDAGTPVDAGFTRIDECGPNNPAQLSSTAVATLREGGSVDAAMRLLYPYDGTVFPGGMTPPLVMWEGVEAEAVLLRLRSSTFEYIGCLLPIAPGQVAIPEHAWEAAEVASAGADDSFELQITALAGGRANGPLACSLVIARGRFAGSIYYMSYGALGTSAMWRVRPKESAQLLFEAVVCAGCHAVAANGTRLVGYTSGAGSSYRIKPGAEPELIQTQLTGGEFGALSPDGAFYLGPEAIPLIGPRAMSLPLQEAALFEVESGEQVLDANIPPSVTTPTFAPSGRLIAFNDSSVAEGRSLVAMDFDPAAAVASGYREVFRDPELYPAWPSFVPGDQAIVFARGDAADFSASGTWLPGLSTPGPRSDLFRVDVSGENVQLLARAMGYSSLEPNDAESYLPFGADDLHQSYYPNVFPVAAGGYAWVFFDSVRHYGNQGMMRQIWGAAIELSAEAGDGSHPPFYVPGQDTLAVNLRAVAVLEPCAASDRTCALGGD